ncbi:MAG TPA: CdaR family protein [Bacillales bacterium]|nr:CdaR family protein [Bacillales bacterium]
MDKLLKKNWFVKFISFLAALMLYTIVSYSQNTTGSPFDFGTSSGGNASNVNQPKSQEVPLSVEYNQKKYIVTGVPQTVAVEMKGSDGLITKAELAKDYKVFINLTGKQPGTYTVPVQINGFPDGLKVTPLPKQVTVTIKKKETETFPVQIDLINESKLASGFEVGEPIVSPSQVRVTTSEDEMSKIAFVEGLVNVKGADDTINQSVALHVYDNKGNEIDAEVSPSVVKVKVPVTGDSKLVPIQMQKIGSLPDGLSIVSIDLQPSQVTLFGSKRDLEGIGYVNIPVDLSNIKKDTTIKLNLTKPDGVTKIAPEQVKVTVNVSKQSTKTFTDVPIDIFDRSDGQTYKITKPEDDQVDVTLSGAKEILKDIKKSDIQVYVDASGLSVGHHTVPIQVNQTNSNVKASPSMDQAEIQVTQGTSP